MFTYSDSISLLQQYICLPSVDRNGWPNQSNVYTLGTSGNNLLAGCYIEGVFVSTDFGESWSQTIINPASVHAFSKTDSFAYCATDYSQFYRSTNLGLNWTQENFPSLESGRKKLLISNLYFHNLIFHFIYFIVLF